MDQKTNPKATRLLFEDHFIEYSNGVDSHKWSFSEEQLPVVEKLINDFVNHILDFKRGGAPKGPDHLKTSLSEINGSNKVLLKDLLEITKPVGDGQTCAVMAFYLANKNGKDAPFQPKEITALFKQSGRGVPGNIAQTLIDLKNKKALLTGSGRDGYVVTDGLFEYVENLKRSKQEG